MNFSSVGGSTDVNSFLRCQLIAGIFADFVVPCCVMLINAVRWFSASFLGLPLEALRSISSPVFNLLRLRYTIQRETVRS